MVNQSGFRKICREFTFQNFAEAVGFVGLIAGIGRLLGHNPDIHIHNNQVIIETWDPITGSVTESEYHLARKIDSLFILA